MRFATKAVHAGVAPDPATGALMTPICQSSTFAQAEVGKHQGFEYGRTGNPTRQALESSLASLENARYGLAYASGLAAELNVLHLLKTGDHVLSIDDVYGGTKRLFRQGFEPFGVSFSYFDRLERLPELVTRSTRLVWVESPTNPLLKIVDLPAAARFAKERGLLLAVDNTFASPYFQNPLDLGADLVVHSTTKYINGHSDVIGGAVMVNDPALFERLKFLQNALGAVPGPFDCFLALRGIKTLPLRMEKHQANALAVAGFLERHPRVERVIYPGLKSHPGHKLARKQMRGFSGVVSFELEGGLAAAKKFLASLKVFALAESLGGVESLAEHPALMTHASVPRAERERTGISDGLVRLSVGIEDPTDLIGDLHRALGRK